MKTMTLTARIASDGTLSLELPTGLPPGPAEIVVVVHPTPAGPAAAGPNLADHPAASARPVADETATLEARRRAVQEFIDRARARKAAAESRPGIPPEGRLPESEPEPPDKFCSGLFLGKLPEDHDIDAALDEMNAQWKAKLEDLRLGP